MFRISVRPQTAYSSLYITPTQDLSQDSPCSMGSNNASAMLGVARVDFDIRF
jgi:hypothetical protein